MEHPQFLNARQAARWLGLAAKTLEKWRGAGSGPLFHRFGRAVRYRVSDLEHFAAEAKATTLPSEDGRSDHMCAAEQEATRRSR